jgi:hypothetical protein
LTYGIAAAGFDHHAGLSLEIAYYAHLFDRVSRHLGPDDTAQPPPSEAEIEFIENSLEDLLEGLSAEELRALDARAAQLGPPAVWPASVSRALIVVDERWGRFASGLLLRMLRQVYLYLHQADTAARIRQLVAKTIGARPAVVVAHSLGSVVVYDLLRRDPTPGIVSSLVTIGSPLAWPTIRRALEAADRGNVIPAAIPWTNVYDPLDVVTGGRSLSLLWPGVVDRPVSNGWIDPHSAKRYLRQSDTAQAVMPDSSSSQRAR